jgi:hypothetical protein
VGKHEGGTSYHWVASVGDGIVAVLGNAGGSTPASSGSRGSRRRGHGSSVGGGGEVLGLGSG